MQEMPLADRLLRRQHLKRYAAQCGLAGLVVLVLLLVLDAVSQTVLIAALGASAFVAFAVPRSMTSDPRHMIGGYAIGVLVGTGMSVAERLIPVYGATLETAMVIAFGALATSIAMFLMVITRSEHPPAAALALGLVLNQWDGLTIAVILIGIIGLSAAKRLVLPMLMDIV